MFDFLKTLIQFFTENNIQYMLSGSVAMSIYTLPRFTRDFDFIVHLESGKVPAVLEISGRAIIATRIQYVKL